MEDSGRDTRIDCNDKGERNYMKIEPRITLYS